MFTARVRSTTGRYCFHRCLSVHRGGYPYPIMLCNISQNAMGQWGGTWPGTPLGVPDWVPPGGTWLGTPPGYPPGGYLTGYPPGGTWLGTPPGDLTGYPPGGDLTGYPGGYLTGYPPRGVPDRVPPQGGYLTGYPPRGGYPGRTTEGVLTTRRAVCLLRSRRRTFLFVCYFNVKSFPGKRYTSYLINFNKSNIKLVFKFICNSCV